MADIAFEKDLSVAETGIGGLKVVDLAVHGDSRGWFKENWQRAKMTALGIPDLRVVQNNISYNCLLYTSPSPRDAHESRMPSSA